MENCGHVICNLILGAGLTIILNSSEIEDDGFRSSRHWHSPQEIEGKFGIARTPCEIRNDYMYLLDSNLDLSLTFGEESTASFARQERAACCQTLHADQTALCKYKCELSWSDAL
jgi:hypothetical protein